ncbi:YveK family protein [Alicyclobacillus sp. ALC3]|uniref:YveK family protein n=1 Tax=Alicyclobacillus sp. ALC3 TaxID=2796143 RepID=UPI0023792721|nr:Wzz/FepE/Etk N-terminal domain-containing protein [Alicyclobacillus sp. ALC3]WDL95246.1 hypothetical protein JC200_12550 [Alicyclobacillus sp. ALC3]
MELREYWYVIRRRLLMVLFIPFVTAIVSGFYIMHRPPTYTVSETVLMTETNQLNGVPDTATDTGVLQSQFFTDIINQDTGSHYTLTDLLPIVFTFNGTLVTMSLNTTDATYGTDLLRAISTTMTTDHNIPGFNGGTVIDPATTTPALLHQKRTIILATAMALIAGLGLAFLREYLDLRFKNEQDIARHLSIPVLGSVDEYRDVKKRRRKDRAASQTQL